MAGALAPRRGFLTEPPSPVGYTAAQAARLTGCTEAQLRYWRRIRLVRPQDRRYSFRDLVALRIVRSLLESGLPLARIQRALRYLVESGEDVAGLRLVTDGEAVWACRDDGQILDALRQGQLALFVAVDRMAADVETEVRAFDAERREFVEGLQGGSESETESG
ncbi:MAG: helix-turn-helix domain-containing protein [Actinomycetota bacterium]